MNRVTKNLTRVRNIMKTLIALMKARNLIKTGLSLFLVILTLSSMEAASLKEGGFVGKFKNSSKVTIILKKAHGREGSFFGLLLKGSPKKNNMRMAIYLIDYLQSQSYTMTPLEITPDGEIGIKNDNPSLVLQIVDNQLIITSSHSDNENSFNGHITFSLNKKSKWKWLQEIEEGNYGKTLSIGKFDETENEVMAIFTHNQLDGQFVIREKFPRMYTLHTQKVTRTGAQVWEIPRAIGVSLKLRQQKIFFLINPDNDKNIFKFSKGKKFYSRNEDSWEQHRR